MSEYEHVIHPSDEAVCNKFVGQDDISVALAVLQELAEKSNHPIVRACLEQAYEDIVHLTSHGNELRDDDGESDAADYS